MTDIIRKNAWTKQPQYPVQIDRSNPLAQGIRHALSFNANHDSVENKLVPVVSDAEFRIANKQRGLYLGTSVANDPNRFVISNPYHPGAANFTVGIYLTFLREAASNDTCVVGTRPVLSGDSASEWALSGNFAATSTDYKSGFTVTSGTTNYNVSDTGKRILNTPIYLVGVKRGTTIQLYRDGILVGENTSGPSSINTTTRAMKFGEFGTVNGLYNLNADIHCFAMWDRALTPSEIKEWVTNPWQLFAPPKRLLFAPPAAAGGFIPAWARGSTSIVGGGIHVA